MNAPMARSYKAPPTLHTDPLRASILETLKKHGPLSARKVLSFHPELKDTVASTRMLSGLAEQGYATVAREEGRNAVFSVASSETSRPGGEGAEARSPAQGKRASAVEADLQTILAQLRANATLTIDESMALFPARRLMTLTRSTMRLRFRELQERGLVVMEGRTRSARYRLKDAVLPAPRGRLPADPPRSPAEIQHTFCVSRLKVLMDAIHAERRMYLELLGASLGSTDERMRQLANAVMATQVVVNELEPRG